jgi:hypothetical protein
MGGWHRMGLDDDFQIRQALSAPSWGSVLVLGSLGSVFHGKIVHYSRYTIFIAILAL